MADEQVHHLSMGVWVIFLAVGIAAIGTYVGIACARRASFSPVRRPLWLTLSSLATGAVAFWLANLVVMAGFAVDASAVRFDGLRVIGSLVVCFAAVAAGLLVGSSRARRGGEAGDAMIVTVMGGGVVMGLGLTAGYYLSMTAIQVQGRTYMDAALIAAAAVVAVVASIGVLWMSVADVPRPVLVGGSLVVAVAPVLMHGAMMAALRVRLDAGAPTPPGVEVFAILFPAFVLGMLVLTAPIVALLMSPDSATAELEARAKAWARE